MILSCPTEDSPQLVSVAVCSLRVYRSEVLIDGPEDTQGRKHHNGLFIDHVDLVADGPDGNTDSARRDGSLGGQSLAWQRVEKGLSFSLGVLLGNVGVVAVLGQGC